MGPPQVEKLNDQRYRSLPPFAIDALRRINVRQHRISRSVPNFRRMVLRRLTLRSGILCLCTTTRVFAPLGLHGVLGPMVAL